MARILKSKCETKKVNLFLTFIWVCEVLRISYFEPLFIFMALRIFFQLDTLIFRAKCLWKVSNWIGFLKFAQVIINLKFELLLIQILKGKTGKSLYAFLRF